MTADTVASASPDTQVVADLRSKLTARADQLRARLADPDEPKWPADLDELARLEAILLDLGSNDPDIALARRELGLLCRNYECSKVVEEPDTYCSRQCCDADRDPSDSED